MLERMRAWLAGRRAERKEREQQEVEDFGRSEDEARRRNEVDEPLQHNHPIDLSRQPPL